MIRKRKMNNSSGKEKSSRVSDDDNLEGYNLNFDKKNDIFMSQNVDNISNNLYNKVKKSVSLEDKINRKPLDEAKGEFSEIREKMNRYGFTFLFVICGYMFSYLI